MNKPNFTVIDKDTNKLYWISRSIVVVAVVIKHIGDSLYVLLEKRSDKMSHPHRWCVPCGYLDWDETLEDACLREVREETGIELDKSYVFFTGYNSNPNELDKQNVSMRFCCFVEDDVQLDMSKIEMIDEVDDVCWKYIGYFSNFNSKSFYVDKDFDKLDDGGKWAFNHNQLILEVLKDYYKDEIKIFKYIS